MRFLIYVRPWNVNYYKAVGERLKDKGCVVSYISEHNVCDDHGLQALYVNSLSSTGGGQYSGMPDDIVVDMISRCRLLRSMPLFEARRHLFAMASAVDKLISSSAPDAVVSVAIDSFVIDLLRFFVEKQGGVFVGLIPSFVNGYFRATVRGELDFLRSPSEDEVLSVLSLLNEKAYTPSFIGGALRSPKKVAMTRWAKTLIKPVVFRLIRALPRYRYNYHYWASQIVADRDFSLFPVVSLGDSKWRETLALSDKPLVYAPLQMHPEATVDYWSGGTSAANYEDCFLGFIEKLGEFYSVVVKEHPGVVGLRSPSFYKKIKNIRNAILIPTFEPSNDVLSIADRVMVFTGSVGFEAALRGKVVISPCKPYYAFGDRFIDVNECDTSSDIYARVERKISEKVDDGYAKELTRNLLKGLTPGDVNFVPWGDTSGSDDVRILNLANFIVSYVGQA